MPENTCKEGRDLENGRGRFRANPRRERWRRIILLIQACKLLVSALDNARTRLSALAQLQCSTLSYTNIGNSTAAVSFWSSYIHKVVLLLKSSFRLTPNQGRHQTWSQRGQALTDNDHYSSFSPPPSFMSFFYVLFWLLLLLLFLLRYEEGWSEKKREQTLSGWDGG